MMSNRTVTGVDNHMGDANELLRDLDDAIDSLEQPSFVNHRPNGRKKKTLSGGESLSDPDSGNSSGGESPLVADYEERKALLKYVEDHVVGKDTWAPGPFGQRQVVYCDYTASGRPLSFIEDYISKHVQPLYANTHTTTGIMARQTTRFRKEARDIIKKCVNATDDDALIFTGSGTTGAVNKLVSALMLTGEKAKKAVVLIGPYEHHSNILPWKESGAKVVRIRDDEHGMVNLKLLEDSLKAYQKKGRLLIGCFSAASNVTGIICNTHPVAALLHKYDALSFWDYATAGPYLPIDMNPENTGIDGDCSKDAIYLSPHKFVGGVGTPGILIAKKKLFLNSVPHSVGGGTVLYVTRETHHYLHDIEEREEGGTPAIIESIRAGLTFKVKHSIGTDLIGEMEKELTSIAFSRLKTNGGIIFLGSTKAERLPIFSFMVVHPKTGKMLHHNFIAVLLNDLYGIQARGGCACAGPYAQDLLGINEELAERFVFFLTDESKEMKKKQGRRKNGKKADKNAAEFRKMKKTSAPLEIMKPGFVRLNLPFFFSDDVINYVLEAVDAVGTNGWKMLSQYKVDPFTSEWLYVGTAKDESKPSIPAAGDSLLKATFIQGKFNAPPSPYVSPKLKKSDGKVGAGYEVHLKQSERLMREAGHQCQFPPEVMTDAVGPCIGDPNLIWFMRPFEACYHIRFPEADPMDVNPNFTEGDGSAGAANGGTITSDPRLKLTRSPFRPKRYTKRSLSRRFSLKKRGNYQKKNKKEKESSGTCSIM